MPVSHPELPNHVEVLCDSIISVRENKRAAFFRNPQKQKIMKVKIDDGLITVGERADYAVVHPQVADVLIELKGSDVSKAIRQLRATLPAWRDCAYVGCCQGALIVRGKGVHPRQQTNIERWKREFRKDYKMRLLVETTNREYEFEEFRP